MKFQVGQTVRAVHPHTGEKGEPWEIEETHEPSLAGAFAAVATGIPEAAQDPVYVSRTQGKGAPERLLELVEDEETE